jgi:glutaconate CoA-transferase subunit B
MIAAAARRLRNGEVVLVGIGPPNVAANLARARHAPDLQLVYESGAVGSVPTVSPLSIGDPTLVAGALASFSVGDVFSYVIEGARITTAFVSAAQIDRAGRLNSTCIGGYESPQVRLPGSGGACEIVEHAQRVLVLAPLERRRFPARVAFATSVPSPAAELVVVTDRAVLTRPREHKEIALTALFSGETVESVQAEIGWPLQVAAELEVEPEELE